MTRVFEVLFFFLIAFNPSDTYAKSIGQICEEKGISSHRTRIVTITLFNKDREESFPCVEQGDLVFIVP